MPRCQTYCWICSKEGLRAATSGWGTLNQPSLCIHHLKHTWKVWRKRILILCWWCTSVSCCFCNLCKVFTLIGQSQSLWQCHFHRLNSSWQPGDKTNITLGSGIIIKPSALSLGSKQDFSFLSFDTVDHCLSPGLCGCTGVTRGRPCPQRHLYTSLAAGCLLGAASGPPWGMWGGSRLQGTRSLYK